MMFILFCALIAVSTATVYRSPYYVSTGTSQQYRDQDASGNYRFGYDENHATGGTFRDETGDAWGNKYGSYGLREADGRYRVVNYVADAQGFRAEVKTNEPGVAPKDPASTTIIKQSEDKPVVFEQKPVVVEQRPVVVEQKPVVFEQKPVVIEQEPIKFVEKQIQYAEKPILYAPPVAVSAPIVHHAYNPEYPLLYQYQTPYYAPYANYKGTPYYGNYKGTPFRRYGHGTYFTKKGAPIVSTKGAPIVSTKGYYIYP